MSRSPLAYPLSRPTDPDVGGAADLQTDVMRFMAILALCLVAIFALVQSIPLTPVAPPAEPADEPQASLAEVAPVVTPVEQPGVAAPVRGTAASRPAEQELVLKRPEWTPRFVPAAPSPMEIPAEPSTAAADEPPVTTPAAPVTPEADGFTLRFASDAALMRAVAGHRVGVYAIEQGRARRMAVSESRISFWDASTPNSFHEMEPGTVPVAVTDALMRTGTEPQGVSWGVTLPGRMTAQLDTLMQQHRGGALVIGANGDIHWEALQ